MAEPTPRLDGMFTAAQVQRAPLSPDNCAAELVTYSPGGRALSTRTLAIAPGLTHEEAVAYVDQYRAPNETLSQFVVYT